MVPCFSYIIAVNTCNAGTIYLPNHLVSPLLPIEVVLYSFFVFGFFKYPVLYVEILRTAFLYFVVVVVTIIMGYLEWIALFLLSIYNSISTPVILSPSSAAWYCNSNVKTL